MVPAQFSPEAEGLLATIVFLSVAVLPPSLCMPPPPKEKGPLLVLPEKVELLTVTVPGFMAVPLLYMPPPTRVALLPEKVELLTVTVPPLLDMPPPPGTPSTTALLPERVELLTVTVPPLLAMPPPEKPSLLPERVELLTVTVPLKLTMPLALLSERVELFTSSVPSFDMPLGRRPPPSATVRLLRVSFAPNPTSNTRC